MQDKSSLYVLDKKEVALILLFMIVISVTSFTFGLKVGKKVSLSNEGFTQSDQRTVVDLESKDEEKVKQDIQKVDNTKNVLDETQKKLEEELDKLKNGTFIPPKKKEAVQQVLVDTKPNDPSAPIEEKKDDYRGRWTVQLGAHDNLKDAKDFADGFTVRGYNPIINEVEIEGRGRFYRVSIGTFMTKAEAQDYVSGDETLFQGQEYMIRKIE